jgi:xanthine/CO dehydrogenase XdhC/CoxF family maturation factor
MKELGRILEVYGQIDLTKRKVALATVVWVEGSSYRRPGARMLITDDGRWEGAISGGCLEGDALRKARKVMQEGVPVLVTYDTMDDDANSLGVGLGCNGIIDVLIEPVDPAFPANPVVVLKEFVEKKDVRVLATVVRSNTGTGLQVGSRFVLTTGTTAAIPGWLSDDMQEVMQSGRPQTRKYSLAGCETEIFMERFDPGIELVIFGAGYDVIPLARLAREIGWQVTVTEDCIAHLSPKRFPAATCVLYADRHAVLEKIAITDRTAAVLMSHNYKYDLAVLESLLKTEVPYIGMLGPRKRFEKMQTEFRNSDKKISPQTYDRVHAPVGLDIGAETPDEIALSVVAEIKAFFSKRPAGFLKEKAGPIHERTPSGHNTFSPLR